MNIFKKLHILVFRSFAGPFFVSTSVVLFVLLLQFIAKYQDDIFGKDIGLWVLAKFCMYATATLIPLSLPLGLLLSSLMTVGNMGERNELAAIKSAGVSLWRIVQPMTYFSLCVVAASMYFTFYIMPRANLKLFSLIYDLSKLKPTLVIEAGHFYKGIEGFVFHAAAVDSKRDMLYKLKIFDHSEKDRKGELKIYIADSAKMVSKSDRYLSLQLFHGVGHEELRTKPKEQNRRPYSRYYFDTLNYHFQLAGFNLENTNEAAFLAPHHAMKNIEELSHSMDSMAKKTIEYGEKLGQSINPILQIDSLFVVEESQGGNAAESSVAGKAPISFFPEERQIDICKKAAIEARTTRNYVSFSKEKKEEEFRRIRKYEIEFYTRIMLPIACLVFLLIGAPLGAIVRKGGIGLPTIVSILFFVIFYVLMMQGRKFAKDNYMNVFAGIFLPNIVLGPIGLILVYQATRDAAIMDLMFWTTLFRKKRRANPARDIHEELSEESGKPQA